MSFKLNFISDVAFALSNHTVVRVSGRDAKLFLQSQCMNDVNALTPGAWQYNGWLSPQGRVMALFYLLELDEIDYLLVLPALPAEYMVSALSRFVFRSKVSIKVDNALYVSGQLLGRSESVNSILEPIVPQPGTRIDLCNDGYRRAITIDATPASLNADALNTWHILDMMNGWPWIGESQQGNWTPHMLSLQALDAFSVKKGCYPGQEIVARTHFLGKNKRRLYFIQGIDLSAGKPVLSAGAEIGKVVDSDASRNAGLAVLPAEGLPADMCNDAGAVGVEKPEIC